LPIRLVNDFDFWSAAVSQTGRSVSFYAAADASRTAALRGMPNLSAKTDQHEANFAGERMLDKTRRISNLIVPLACSVHNSKIEAMSC